VAIDEIARLRIAQGADHDQPAARRCASQIIKPVKTGFVIEVGEDDQRSEVGVPHRSLCARSGTLDAGGEALQFQVRGKLVGAIQVRIEQQNGLATYRDTPDWHLSSPVNDGGRSGRISLNPIAQGQIKSYP
jgi:hypothetical protein